MPPQLKQSETLIEQVEQNKPLDNRKEILYEGYYYDVTDWIPRHPGGQVIKFYTEKGEDSTLAVQQFHNRSMKKIIAIMKSFKRRPAQPEETGLNLETLKRNEALTKDFQKLHKELEDEGYFKPSILHTIYRLTELAIINILTFYFLTFSTIWGYILAGIMFGIFGGRCGWYMHEGGHHSITGNPKADRFIQSFVMGYGAGLSAQWWSSQHNRHHAMPQRLQHDVDLKTLPLMAFNSKVVDKGSKAGQSFFVQNQSKLFVIIDAFLVMWLWKSFLGPRYAWRKGAYLDLFFIVLHFYLFVGIMGIWSYQIGVWVGSVCIFVNFALSHTHLPVTDEPLHWVEYSLNHTTDIEPSFIVDWWMGYLNYQIEHHLFPTMPQFRQRAVSEKVKVLATKHNIPYRCMSYMDALKKTFQNLDHVAEELREIQ